MKSFQTPPITPTIFCFRFLVPSVFSPVQLALWVLYSWWRITPHYVGKYIIPSSVHGSPHFHCLVDIKWYKFTGVGPVCLRWSPLIWQTKITHVWATDASSCASSRKKSCLGTSLASDKRLRFEEDMQKHLWWVTSLTANWVIICHLPPFRGTRNNHWPKSYFIFKKKRLSDGFRGLHLVFHNDFYSIVEDQLHRPSPFFRPNRLETSGAMPDHRGDGQVMELRGFEHNQIVLRRTLQYEVETFMKNIEIPRENISSNDSDMLPNTPNQTTSKSSWENIIKYQAISRNKSILFCVSRRVWCFGFGIQASCLNFGTSKIGCSTCSQQLRFVEVDPEEHCRAKGDDENCPAKLQQCIARVASMCNFRDGQHCSGKRSCLGYPVFWHCLHLASSSLWSGDKCHVGKTKKCKAHSHHQKRRGATSHGECQTAKLRYNSFP